MSFLQLPELIDVFLGLAYPNQDLLGNIAWVPAVVVEGGWGLCCILERMVILPELIDVFLGLAYPNQDLLGNIAWVPAVVVEGGWGLCCILERMVILPSLDWVLPFSLPVPGLNIYPNLWGLFHKVSSVLISDICGRLQVSHYSVDGKVLKKFYQCQAVVRLGS